MRLVRRYLNVAITVSVTITILIFGEWRNEAPAAGTSKVGRSAVPGFRVTESNSARTSIRLGLDNLRVENVLVDGAIRQRLSFNGSETFGVVGSPEVPVIRKLIAIPTCARIEIDYEVIAESTIENIEAAPHPRTHWDDENRLISTFEENQAAYNRDEDFPGEVARLVKIGYARGQRLALVELAPVHYNPVTKRVRVIEDLEVTIKTIESVGPVFVNVGPMSGVISDLTENSTIARPAYTAGIEAPLLTGATGEYKWCGGSTASSAADSVNSFGADYIIIVAEELSTDTVDVRLIDSLAQHRVDYNGFNVAIVSLDQLDAVVDTTATPDSIRSFIKKIYDNGMAPNMGDGKLGYVLLLGDAWNPNGSVVIPTYHGFQTTTGSGQTRGSDAYYSLLGPDVSEDPFPDVYLGRLPVDADDDNWEIRNVVRKTIDFEPLPEDEEWIDKLLLIAGDSPTDSSHKFFEYIKEHEIPGDVVVDEIHRYLDGFSSNAECSRAICDSLEHDYWFGAFYSHGNPFNVQNTLSQLHYDTLSNSVTPVLAFQMCEGGRFDYYPDVDGTTYCGASPGYGCTDESWSGNFSCGKPSSNVDACDVVSERILVQRNGAVGTFGYTRKYGIYQATNDFYNLFAVLFSENASTLGDILLGIKMLGANYDQTLYNYSLFGDPALNILWRDVEHDSVDATISRSGILGRNGTPYVNSGETDELSITVKNIARENATNIPMEIWWGDPEDSSSTRLDSLVIDEIDAYGSNTSNYSVLLSNPGIYEIFVRIDPENEISELSEANNVAGRVIIALPYHNSSFPVKLKSKAHHFAVASDVHANEGEELLIATSSGVYCYASGDAAVLWRFHRADSSPKNIRYQIY